MTTYRGTLSYVQVILKVRLKMQERYICFPDQQKFSVQIL